jgi:hypothetical protein
MSTVGCELHDQCFIVGRSLSVVVLSLSLYKVPVTGTWWACNAWSPFCRGPVPLNVPVTGAWWDVSCMIHILSWDGPFKCLNIWLEHGGREQHDHLFFVGLSL